ncbi:MAG: DUF4231 domain-containing protein [Sporolactobacillus sp.]
MDEKTYVEERLDNQLIWYDKKSIMCQNKYKCIKMTEFIISGVITVLAGTLVKFECLSNYISILLSILGVSITIFEGYLTMGKFHENWIEYRSISETLKKEKYMYLTKTGVYEEGDAPKTSFTTLVERVESIISNENVNWANLNSNDEGRK